MTPEEACRFISTLEASGKHHTVKYRGRPMSWRHFGEGQPLVLLHGGHGSWLHWVKNIQFLARTRAVWVPDLPGFGDSAALDETAELEDLLSAMLMMLAEIFGRNTQFDLSGFSFGGLVAANIAARCHNVRKLALFGSAGHGGVRRQDAALVNWRLSETEAQLEAVMRHNLAAHMLSDPHKIDSLALAAHIRSCRNTRFRSRPISRSGGLPAALQRSTVPTLLVWGENDITADPAVILPALTNGYPHRQAQVVAHGGHWVQFECHEDVNRILHDWLGEPV